MNILFMSLGKFRTIQEQGIYTDLLRRFMANGDTVYVLSPIERRERKRATILREGSTTIIQVGIGNIQKTNAIEKGISTLLLETQLIRAVKRELGQVKFDLVLYPTPPITFVRAVMYIKQRDKAVSYLMLKDIFPQNAIDMGMLSASGPKGIIYRFFRRKERRLYGISDWIGCMSEANARYVIANNPEVPPSKVEICPNCIEVHEQRISPEERRAVRSRYGIPQDRRVFVYGGNLGRPQGIAHIIECVRACDGKDFFFVIAGDGTEFSQLKRFVDTEQPGNLLLINRLPREEYIRMTDACDIGLIFLDHRFTIPNFPSRLLDYMQSGLPVLACTDPNTDIGKVIVEGGFGWWCESDSVEAFLRCIDEAATAELAIMGENARAYLKSHYSVATAYAAITSHL